MRNRAKKSGKALYVVYADFVSALDSVDFLALFAVLRAYGIPDVDLLETLYRASPFQVVTPFGSTAKIQVGRGCRQGDVLSPLIFDLFVNVLLRYLNESGVGAHVTETGKVNQKAFADDIALVTASLVAAQELMDRLQAFCSWPLTK